MASKSHYITNGVIISPAFPSTRSRVQLTYTGILAQNGAQEIFARIGFGHNWEKTQEYKMDKTAPGFETSFPLPEYTENFHICFRDSAGNWDNNSGTNYTFDVRQPDAKYSFDYEHEVYASRKI